LGSRIRFRFSASRRRCSSSSRPTQLDAEGAFAVRRERNQLCINPDFIHIPCGNQGDNCGGAGRYNSLVPRALLGTILFLSGCAALERPISPWRLEGFPGAPIEPGLFPLRHGTAWEFRDRLDPAGPTLRLELVREGEDLVLRGGEGRTAGVSVSEEDGYLTLSRHGQVVDRPLAIAGKVGDSWPSGPRRATAFGYDRVFLLGREMRALVVAVDGMEGSARARSLYWFARDLGWVRIRTEREGRVTKDAHLVAFTPTLAAD